MILFTVIDFNKWLEKTNISKTVLPVVVRSVTIGWIAIVCSAIVSETKKIYILNENEHFVINHEPIL